MYPMGRIVYEWAISIHAAACAIASLWYSLFKRAYLRKVEVHHLINLKFDFLDILFLPHPAA